MGKTLKTLEHLLRKTAIGVLTVPLVVLPGCHKPEEPVPDKDTTPPKITIYSPVKNEEYDSKTIHFEWDINEPNFNSAYYSTDNRQTKNPIGKSGSRDIEVANGENELILYADDKSTNSSTSIVDFLVNEVIIPKKIVVNPFVQPNDSTMNWYGSGISKDYNRVREPNLEDLAIMDQVIAGTFSDPSDTRLYDRLDVNVDGKVDQSDRKMLSDKIMGLIPYLSAYWNKLQTRAEKEDLLSKELAIDKTNEINPFPGWDCTQFMDLTYINFHGVELKDIDYLFKIYPYDFSNNGRFNIPIYQLTMSFYDSNDKYLGGHAMNTTFLSSTTWEDRCDIEPQFDHMNVQIGQDYFQGTNSIVWIRGPPVIESTDLTGVDGIPMIYYFIYKVKDDIPTLLEQNPEIELN